MNECQMRGVRIVRGLPLLSALLALVGPAWAGVISVAGNATLIPRPADAQLGVLTDNTTAFVWNEAQGVELSSPVAIDAAAPGFYASALDFDFANLDAGSIVSSQFIHFDTMGGSTHTVEGSITLDADIIGVIAWNKQDSRHLDDSDAPFGLGTLFTPNLNRRGIFDAADGSPPQEDNFTVSDDARTLSFFLTVSSPFDEIRVLTAAVPEPGTLGMLSLLALGVFRRPRRR